MMANTRLYWLTLLILAASTTAVILIPWGPFWGLDFQNIDAFHDCVARDNPYLGTGALCGDALDRDMYYPPTLYWVFAWTRLFPFETAYALWSLATIVGSALALSWWVPRDRRDLRTLGFGALLLLQFPMVFALERGNNDVIVLVLWTASAWFLTRRQPTLAGFIAGVAVLLKLYPAFAVLVVLAGLLRIGRRDRAAGLRLARYCIGGFIAVLVVGLPFAGQTMDFLQDEAQVLAGALSVLHPGSHGLHLIAPGGHGWLLSIPLLLVWAWASYRRLQRDPMLVLAGSLAISTYFASLSNDYNLITTYPLLIVLFVRATTSHMNVVDARLLLLGLIAIVGHRGVFLLAGWEAGSMLHIWLEWAWLLLAGLATASWRLLPAAAPDPTTSTAGGSIGPDGGSPAAPVRLHRSSGSPG